MKSKRNRKQKRKENILAIFIAVIMIGSVFGVMFYGFASSNQKYNYKDYTFKSSGNSYSTKINGNIVKFYSLPEQIESLEFPESAKNLIKNSPAPVLTFSPNDRNIQYIELIRFELGELIMSNTITKVFIPGITEKSEQYNIPILDCSNTSISQPVILFRTGNKTEISEINNCIIMQASNSNDFLTLRDQLFYLTTGIIE